METAKDVTEDVGKEAFSFLQPVIKHVVNEQFLVRVIISIVLLLVCLLVKRLLLKGLKRGLEHTKIEKSLHTFLRSFTKIILWFIIILIVVGSLGIDITSLIAVLSVAGLAISLSLQGSLSNLSSGVTILLTKPFVVGDYIEIGEISGTVMEIDMIYTKLDTFDNRRILLPNSNITSATVTNWSTASHRRVELDISASYDAPVETVKAALRSVIDAHPLAQSDPEPFVRVLGYGDHAIEYAVRVWCENENYWTLYFDLLEQIKVVFDEQEIEMTYPHMNVHIIENGGSRPK